MQLSAHAQNRKTCECSKIYNTILLSALSGFRMKLLKFRRFSSICDPWSFLHIANLLNVIFRTTL